MKSLHEVTIINLGLVDYKEAWDLQENYFRQAIDRKIAIRNGENLPLPSNYLILCEHPHVYTIGKSGKEENLLLSEKEVESKEKYDPSFSNFWIQKFLKDNNYSIKDNEAGGECLFAAIRDAYKTIGKENSVAQLRELVASKATQDIFDNYRALYDSTFGPIDKLKKDRQLLLIENKKILNIHKLSKDKEEQQKIQHRNKEIIKENNELKIKIAELEADLLDVNYLKDLKNVNTLGKFKEYIKSCNFWGESWAISILEYFLKIKLILLDRTKYKDSKKDNENVIFCGDQIYPDILTEQSFSPTAYIILDYNGSHFQLITYKGRGIFSFDELPFKIKLLIKKCTLVRAGSYYLIPELIAYKIEDQSGGTRRNKFTRNSKTRKQKV